MNGRHRHVLVDAQGLLLEVLVQPANVRERAGGQTLLTRAKARPSCGRLAKVWADGGFDGEPFRDWTRENCGWELEVAAKPPGRKGFAVLPRRRVVERSFGWLARFRRLARDSERLDETVAGRHWLAFAGLMPHRFTRFAVDSS